MLARPKYVLLGLESCNISLGSKLMSLSDIRLSQARLIYNKLLFNQDLTYVKVFTLLKPSRCSWIPYSSNCFLFKIAPQKHQLHNANNTICSFSNFSSKTFSFLIICPLKLSFLLKWCPPNSRCLYFWV